MAEQVDASMAHDNQEASSIPFDIQDEVSIELDEETNTTLDSVEECPLPQRPSIFASLHEYGDIFNGLIEVLKCPEKTRRYFKEVAVTFQNGAPVAQFKFAVRNNNLTKGSVLTIHSSEFFSGHCQTVVANVSAKTVSGYVACSTAKEIFSNGESLRVLDCDIEVAPDENQLVPYQRMQTALEQFISCKEDECDEVTLSILGRAGHIDEVLQVVSGIAIFNDLNANQLEAVRYCLRRPLSLISAPPGTGKTRMAAALAHYFASERGCRVLVCAPSNNAADKLAEALDEQAAELEHVEIVRIYSRTKEKLQDVPAKIRKYALHKRLRERKSRFECGEFEEIYRLQDFTGIGLQSETDEDEQTILEQADIVVTTCSAAGDKRLDLFGFSVVIIDEATQCLEPECLIPITRGARQVILFGDAKQLGPVIEIQSAVRAGYNVSMFERLLPILGSHQLNVQYRMHPIIAKFSSEHFYEGALQNGVSRAERRLKPEVPAIFPTGPITWFDNCKSREEFDKPNHSFRNKCESSQVAYILEHLFVSGIEPDSIGVIAMYKSQVYQIHSTLTWFKSQHVAGWNDLVKNVKVGTVDGFQGQEKDIIIMSCVRANDNAAIGFLNDERRLNVAMTRARYGLAIVGNRDTLVHSDIWKELIEYCRKNGSILSRVPGLKRQAFRLGINPMNGTVSYSK